MDEEVVVGEAVDGAEDSRAAAIYDILATTTVSVDRSCFWEQW